MRRTYESRRLQDLQNMVYIFAGGAMAFLWCGRTVTGITVLVTAAVLQVAWVVGMDRARKRYLWELRHRR